MNTTSKTRGMHPNAEMSFIGYTIAAILFVGLLPLLPFFLLYYVVDALMSGRRDGGGS